ncbi:uncharacterized protein MONOS_9091 [Monocercomonoides exilis]|uniref:uncharacterized protein n=1 Tax=Monocercomonoides exilis TaxID=2049356 RepID=UPI00355A3DC0|nr:hypothetical protein MONOS_9091 [Monocercomonoides exilis]|eukprot:MONOS_9091.1-p1 / transcript=MONOS_9091.1 / gene=MONOS_9091 / organism=Monocercomonoides_exilis_PA203 / gene_product=unspecified product / transcript_product=unspecified product / location=Mono_scaffold00364:8169-8617(-) / protein_length=115 / sequence_SO=supercontig / SO=protein_coding / is_pseudo=false
MKKYYKNKEDYFQKEIEETDREETKSEKCPKEFEKVTMEMSLEEQWRKAENDAEKVNKAKTKLGLYSKKIAHSEPSEYLLAESGSTEYILGHDSDKIPEWVLEKEDEKEDDDIE